MMRPYLFRDTSGHLKKISGSNTIVHPNDFVSLIKDIFDISLYRKLLSDPLLPTGYQQFESNESFWQRAIGGELREGMRVHLRKFHVIEWIPISPGKFFTPEADAARKKALKYVSIDHDEFLPLGKTEMVLGGIGSVRLKSRVIEQDRFFFIGATASGVSHEGIPLLVRFRDFHELTNSFIDHGGIICDIQGYIRVLPDALSIIGTSGIDNWGTGSGINTSLPKYCIEVEGFLKHDASKKGDLLATAAIMFPSRSSRYHHESQQGKRLIKSWTFCSFDPSDGIYGVNKAAYWLQNYVYRYSGDHGQIFSDFDEQFDHFQSNVEFPLRAIRSGNVDLASLREYQSLCGGLLNVNVENIIMGDNTTQTITGGTFFGPVAANMEHCKTIINQQTSDQRKQLLEAVQQEAEGLIRLLPEAQRANAADDLKLLVNAAVANEPKRHWYMVSSQGLLEASKFVKDFTGNIAGTIGQLGKLLWPDFELPSIDNE